MSNKVDANKYIAMYGPTVGDKVRLADTNLFIEVEDDYTVYGDECKFGGGKTLRDGMGQSASVSSADGALDLVITNALIECLQNAGFHSTTEEFISVILNKIADIENHGRIHMYLICEAITGNEVLKERFKIKYIEWRKALELEIQRATRFKDDSYPISFLLISIVDGLVVQSLLKTEKLPYGEISRFLIDKLK